MYSLVSPILIEELHMYYLDICELFLDGKMENGVFGQIPKNTRHRIGTHLKHNCKYNLY